MAEATLELRAILDAAERAANAEEFVSAEQLLRQAAALQEAQLGAGHPDLANTLNNLGIVCECLGTPTEAEACYRRAYLIATTSLPADHPLVATSGQNLRDFCAATGTPFAPVETGPPHLDAFAAESPATAPPPARGSTAAPPRPPAATPGRSEHPEPRQPATVRAPERPARQPTAAARVASPVSPQPIQTKTPIALAIAGVLLFALAAWWFELRSPSRPEAPASPRVESVAPRERPSPPPDQPEQTVTNPVAGAAATPAIPSPPVEAAEASPPPRDGAETGAASVAEAKLCRSLSTSDWACTPASNRAAPGAFFFYTRVRSMRDTTVQHRWYVNGRLLRSVNLRVGANSGAGYRTYSRNTVAAELRGDWSIELRDEDGALLHEERFIVQ